MSRVSLLGVSRVEVSLAVARNLNRWPPLRDMGTVRLPAPVRGRAEKGIWLRSLAGHNACHRAPESASRDEKPQR
jgi:hypothetical protein